jgi:exosome complex component RRP42
MITKKYVESILAKGTRIDGRKLDDYRDISIEYGISAKSAEGSARVKIGDTEVIAGIKLGLEKPYPDNPDKGSIMVNVELLPLSSTLYEGGPPSIDAIELSRVTDRGIRESNTIDFKKLCVTPGEACWMIFIDIYPINAGGNLFDAATIAAMAALRDAVYPKLEDGKVNYYEKTKNKLPLQKLPISCTIWKINESLVLDPLVAEELASDARLTIVYTEDDKICAMQKGGKFPLTPEDVAKMTEMAHKQTKEIRKKFKK